MWYLFWKYFIVEPKILIFFHEKKKIILHLIDSYNTNRIVFGFVYYIQNKTKRKNSPRHVESFKCLRMNQNENENIKLVMKPCASQTNGHEIQKKIWCNDWNMNFGILWCNKLPFYFSKLMWCFFHLTAKNESSFIRTIRKRCTNAIRYTLFYIYLFIHFYFIFVENFSILRCDSGFISHETALVTKKKIFFFFLFFFLKPETHRTN